jgi:heme oxygenase
MSRSATLREATRDAHEQMEQSLNLFHPEFTIEDYQHLLRQWYGFHAAWEPASAALFGEAMADFLQVRRKLPLLADDLGDLEPAAPAPIMWTDRSDALGTLYVIEGSTLGGQLITRKLQDRYGVSSSFFASYGPDIGRRWQETKQLLDRPPFEVEDAKVIDGARRTFEFLQAWLEQPD